jgi:hypothetical protein
VRLVTDGPLSIRDLLPLATAVAGYAVGGLRTALANVRERHKALNSLLYVLLQLRFELKRSNPTFLLDALSKIITSRYGPDIARSFGDPNIRRLLNSLLENAIGTQSAAASARYNDAVHALAPFHPLLAYRLTGEQVIQYEAFVKRYYDAVRQQPDILRDASAPAALGTMERQTLDLAFTKAMEQLAEDALQVAKASWTLKRFYARGVLQRQDAAPDSELAGEGGAMLNQMFQQFEEILTANLGQSVAPASNAARGPTM